MVITLNYVFDILSHNTKKLTKDYLWDLTLHFTQAIFILSLSIIRTYVRSKRNEK